MLYISCCDTVSQLSILKYHEDGHCSPGIDWILVGKVLKTNKLNPLQYGINIKNWSLVNHFSLVINITNYNES